DQLAALTAFQRHLDRLVHGEVTEEAGVLEYPSHAEGGASVGGGVRHVVTQDLHGSSLGSGEAAHDVHQRRLAGAVGTDESDDLVAAGDHRHAVEHHPPAEVNAHVAGGQGDGSIALTGRPIGCVG